MKRRLKLSRNLVTGISLLVLLSMLTISVLPSWARQDGDPPIDQDPVSTEEPVAPEALTDMAADPPPVDLAPSEDPEQRKAAMGWVQPVEDPAMILLPEGEDMVELVETTETLAEPPAEAPAPDPFIEPPMAVDPERIDADPTATPGPTPTNTPVPMPTPTLDDGRS